MMDVDRQLLAEKIRAYHKKELTKNDLALWAYECRLSVDLDQMEKDDPLVHDVILTLIKYSEQPQLVPPRDTLQLYLSCLEGTQKYVTQVEGRRWSWKRFLVVLQHLIGRLLFFTMRVYVIIFAIGVMVVNYLVLQLPEAFESPKVLISFWAGLKNYLPLSFYSVIEQQIADPQFYVFIRSIRPQHEMAQIPLLHLLFALLALLPPTMVVKTIIFTIALPMLGLGMLYYWFVTWEIAAKVAFVFMIEQKIALLWTAAGIGIPATLAFILLLIKTRSYQTK